MVRLFLKLDALRISDDAKFPKEVINKFLSKYIVNEVITLTSENPSYEVHFETKLQAKFDKSDKILNSENNN